MPQYTQEARPLRVNTVLGSNVLLLAGFKGQEGVCKSFVYHLELFSSQNDINAKDLLRTAATVELVLPNQEVRYINGLVSRFAQLGQVGDLIAYRMEIVPWLWFYSLSRDCKIFQNKTVPEIVEKIFKDRGNADYELKLTRSYSKREYCVQYRETTMDFLTRLLEDEGIFYFFKHTDGKHVLVLSDNISSIQECPGYAKARVQPEGSTAEDAVINMQKENAVHIGKVTYSEYDYLQPSLTLRSSITGTEKEEVYDYLAVAYTKLEDGERYARNYLEAHEALHEMVRAKSTCRFLQSGHKFTLSDHYRSDFNQSYTVLEVKHLVETTNFLTVGAGLNYQNEFTCIPSSVPYRPFRSTEKPVVRGAQTAVVVGKAGEEIYVDSHGRVKIQFHWDRDGKKNESSSCWVRVSSTWAGKGWGGIHIPRIGQEVLVDFIEGDPDRPVIVGRLYNAEQTPPYALPANGTQSGIKSRSSKGGGTDNFNEIRLEDKKGSELFYEQAEKDMEIYVKHDRKETVDNDETITVKGNRTEEVHKEEKITIKGGRTEEVQKDEKVTVKGKRDHSITKDDILAVTGNQTVKVTGDQKLEVTKNINVESKIQINVKANAGIELKVGGSSIKITPASIELKAPVIKLESQGPCQIKGAIVQAEATGIMQVKGAMTMVNGSGLLKLQGGITMIN